MVRAEFFVQVAGEALAVMDQIEAALSLVMVQPRIDNTRAITQFDQLHPEVTNPSLKEGTPEGLVHETYRLGIMFNGSIRKFDKDNNP